jgi:hypothetical protein
VDLTTTNVLLGIMATVSLLEAAALIAVLGGGLLMYRRQITPVRSRVTGILDDIKGLSGFARWRHPCFEAGRRRERSGRRQRMNTKARSNGERTERTARD